MLGKSRSCGGGGIFERGLAPKPGDVAAMWVGTFNGPILHLTRRNTRRLKKAQVSAILCKIKEKVLLLPQAQGLDAYLP
jgi:hypothetical protein